MYTVLIALGVSEVAFWATLAAGTVFFNKQGRTRPRTRKAKRRS